jgi:hypothetical protein
MGMEYKSFTPQVKAAGEGKATVVIATLLTKDRDGDVLLPGAFGEQVVPVVPAHDWKSPAIGKARIRESRQEAIAEIDFYLTTEAGKNWYHAIKEDFDRPPPTQQYSWGFSVGPQNFHHGEHEGQRVRFLKATEDGKPLQIHEVSPVLVAAGVQTRSVSVKAFDDLPEPESLSGEWDDLKAAGVVVQSLIFPKRHWDSADAVRSWLRSHDYKTELDTTESSYRARQLPPGDFSRLRSFCINPSRESSSEACRVMAVGGPRRESRGMSLEQESPVSELAPGRWAVGVHSTEVDAKSWDTSIQVHRIHATGAPGYYRQIYAAQNPHADLTSKGSFAFPHHFIGADGEPGAASVRACAEGLVILQRYWNGLVPDEELKGIHAHLSAHLKDAGREPPELRSAGDVRYPLDDQIELVLWRLEDVLHQIDHVRDMRSRKGMALTEARLGQIDKLQQYFATLCSLVKIKNLDKPSDLVLQELSAEARAEAFGRRIEEMRAKVVKEAQDTEAAEIALRVQRWQHRLRG